MGNGSITTPSLTNSQASSFPKAPSTEEEWKNLITRLALVIADLSEDEYLVVSEKKRVVYVQFAAQGFFGIRVEAVSRAFSGSDVNFSKKKKKILRAMGWRKPTYAKKPGVAEPPDGSCNYYIDARSASCEELATLAVRTLRDVYCTRHPSSLQYYAFGKEMEKDYDIRFPTLGLKREKK